jgi:putative DNA methylase
MSLAEVIAPPDRRRPSAGEDVAVSRRAVGGIERRFDVPFVARLALKEKQIQQNVRPVIAVHKWFARRPGTLFRALLLAEMSEAPLADEFHRPQAWKGVRVADPFMGGGTPLFEANRMGCDVNGWDVNPMAWWIVRQELAALDVAAYLAAARVVEEAVCAELARFYGTDCTRCGAEARVKYFLWVKTRRCRSCRERLDLFPGHMVAASGRHPHDVLVCATCGHLAEVDDRHRPGECPACGEALSAAGPAKRNRCRCSRCGDVNHCADPDSGAPEHRMFAIEYHCSECRPVHRGRFFKAPDAKDLALFGEVERRLAGEDLFFAPDEEIPPGDETARLHRWGYRRWRELFNARQLLGLNLLAQHIAAVEERPVREALATNLSDLLRYQNMLCRYDTRSLKSLDIFSVHGFPVGLVQCESNLFGIRGHHGGNVGSGGWSNIVTKFAAAKRYCERPFEVVYDGRRHRRVSVEGEWIGGRRGDEVRRVELRCASASEAELEPGSFDVILTDPPYLANVQYAELMDFCYGWLRRLVRGEVPSFAATTTKRSGDLTGNQTQERGLEQFAAGLSAVFSRFGRALVPGGPFVFTFHHNELSAYMPVIVALLDAGLVGTTTLPCPAEMGGSIHIHRTESSILDSVFVCRSEGAVPRRLVESTTAAELADLLSSDLSLLRQGGVEPTRGDARCLAFGHLSRLVVWRLRGMWDIESSWEGKLGLVAAALSALPSWEEVEVALSEVGEVPGPRGAAVLGEVQVGRGGWRSREEIVEFGPARPPSSKTTVFTGNRAR